MFPALMMSMVIVPVILGTMVGKRRRRRHAFGLLLGLMVVYDTFYMLMLFYLRVRWVGGGWLG